ncbi:DUF3237 domain-containing protein [Sphingopyxis sp. MWB1]|uniref:DUF3237 domain-containing protein n=1 Tax=Sphingopyxis sp. MWB1 TaxID=1537715 RepID=UPI0009DCB5A2|nr:DUF3237 domain-containing protein [Sphingopyxis sp. MWB1]
MTSNHRAPEPTKLPLNHRYLCTAEFEVGGGLIGIGAAPFGDMRMGYVTGGRFFGPRVAGRILPGGGNWSRGGRLGDDVAVGTFDARAVWEADDGALVYVTYGGRTRIPDAVREKFADPAQPPVDAGDYYLRIAPLFETASERHGWLNGVLAVGVGERTSFGVRHHIYEIL